MRAAGVLLTIAGSFVGLFYLSTYAYDGRRPIDYKKPDPLPEFRWSVSSPGWASAILKLDQVVRAGKTNLTYRGKEGRSAIKLDAVFPDLDREYVYKRKIDIDKALEGFQVGRERFKLMSVHKTKIQILHYTGF